MHNEPRQQLCQLIAQYGRSLSEDPRRCGALLKDHCGQYKREIFVLVNALENGVAEELVKASSGVPIAILLSRLNKRLEDELGLAETAAKWAVETWALALGVIDQPLPTSVPTTIQPAQPISQSTSSLATASSVPSDGGKLMFPKFSVGKVKIGGKEQAAVGEINVPQGQKIELKVSDDVTDFSFLETCDPNKLILDLDLDGCGFDESELKYLNKLTSLQLINLSNCGVRGYDEQSWMNLKNLKDLICLDLSGCEYIGDDSLKYISNLNALRYLKLNMSQCTIIGNIFITDNGLQYLEKLTNLETLDLSKCTKINGHGLKYLRNLTQLKHLILSECKSINGTAILAASECIFQLQLLNLTGCNISPSRLQELKQMLPNTRILP